MKKSFTNRRIAALVTGMTVIMLVMISLTGCITGTVNQSSTATPDPNRSTEQQPISIVYSSENVTVNGGMTIAIQFAGQSSYVTSLEYDADLPVKALDKADDEAAPSENPADSTEPVGSDMPVDSTEPVGSDMPADSTEPAGSDMPADSTEPVGTMTPDSDGRPLIKYTIRTYTYDENGERVYNEDFDQEFNQNGIITITPHEIGGLEVYAESCWGESACQEFIVVRQNISFWDIIIIGLGLYELVLGISGKGRIYKYEYLKEGMEAKYKLITRICCIVVAILMIGSGIVSAFDPYGSFRILRTILFIAAIVAFIAGILVTNRMIDKKAMKEAEERRDSGLGSRAPSSAFEFDEDEPTIDDIKKNN